MINRRQFAVAAAAGVCGASMGRGWAAQRYRFRLGTNLPLPHPLNLRAREAVARIRSETGGAVDIEVVPNSQLGGDAEMLGLLRNGALDFNFMGGLVLSASLPIAGLNAVGFAFADYRTVWAAMDGDLGDLVRRQAERNDLHIFETVWDNGFRHTTTRVRTIGRAGDFAGLRIRVPVGTAGFSLFKALGAEPTPLDFKDLYSALAAGQVDAEENPLAIIRAARLYEVQAHVSLTGHMWDGFYLVASQPAWLSLPGEIQRIITDAFNAAGRKQRDDLAAINTAIIAQLQDRGMTVARPDPTPFREALHVAAYYTQAKAKYGPDAWSVLERYVGSLS